MGLTYCVCTSASSLCNACFGSTAAGTTGRKRSVLLLTMTVAFALLFQYYIAPNVITHKGWWNMYTSTPGVGKRMYNSWVDGCDVYKDEHDLYSRCVGNSGVYRPTCLSAFFFVVSAIAARFRPALNREAWPAKYGIFIVLLLGAMFVPNHPLFNGIFLVSARIGAMVFVIIQQIILIDVAYNWNESWVERCNEADRIEYGSGVWWLRAIIAMCVVMYGASLTGIVLLYHFFSGCPENNAVTTLTLLGIVAITAIQLSGTEGSLLTSSVISAYSTYLAYSLVSKNPNGQCNPQLGTNDAMGIVIGLLLTAISLAWTAFSWTAEGRLNVESAQTTKSVAPSTDGTRRRRDPNGLDLDVPFLDPEDQPTSGFVAEADEDVDTEDEARQNGADLWKLNVVLVFISCWIAMMLTGWGMIQGVSGKEGEEEHTAANPTVGRVNMAMIGISQWMALIMYAWTLLAPRIFPDRDFS
mmetsp:Transcript_11206/g.33167  ORF Transcript_11206/g.33167 Transcript_11206/m.33167 type:complete len:469 (-) Transcript_11206:382-1788(-)